MRLNENLILCRGSQTVNFITYESPMKFDTHQANNFLTKKYVSGKITENLY